MRAQIEAELRGGPSTARELSSRVGIPERDVVEHLEHLAKSLKARGGRLIVSPASCLACGYTFRGRARLTRPGACPECRATHIEAPAFEISAPSAAGE